MGVLKSFIRQYPAQCFIVWVCVVVAGFGEGLTLTTMLPLLSMARGTSGSMGDSGAADTVASVLAFFDLSPTLSVLVTLIVVGLLVKTVLSLLAYRQVGYTVAMIATDLRLRFLRALSNSRWLYFLRQRAGGLANTVSTEATRSASAFENGAKVADMLSQSVIFLCVAMLVNWRAAILALVAGSVLFMSMRVFVKISRKAGSKQQRMFQSLLTLLTDSLASLKPLKSMARESEMDALIQRQTNRLNKALRKQVLSKEALRQIQEFLIGLVMVAGVVAALVIWDLKLPEVMVLVVVLARMLTKLSKVQQRYQKMAVSESFYWSMEASITEASRAEEEAFGCTSPTLETGIELSGVSFSYENHAVLSDINLTIPAGGAVAVVGPSGAGKTTLVDLIIGLLRTERGRITIDGVPIDDMDIRAWRSMIGYVPQDTTLLHDTILANVTVGNPEISEMNAVWALKKSGAWDFVSRLPDGVYTDVGEHGGRFSGGQRQRIVIARALAHEPKLLILDEATSALDPETEASVSATLRELGSEYTILSISHQPTFTKMADRIYYIDGGRATLAEADQLAVT
ncbi:ABC transporter ATP-binding protein [Salinisphaera orenii]|uniref:ABC transporter ATP-binding protein n=1 Tax=Salinisphaera orenii TaxID=856731 RepID=UPI0013A67289